MEFYVGSLAKIEKLIDQSRIFQIQYTDNCKKWSKLFLAKQEKIKSLD